MTMTRSLAGISNQHRFHNADVVLYCESDPEKPPEVSIDAGFWVKVLKAFAPELRVSVRRLGGKTNVLAIADALDGASGGNTICALDRDFDDIHRTDRNYPYVIYSYGYSVENDLCHLSVLSDAIDNSLPGDVDRDDLLEKIASKIGDIHLSIRRIVVADQILSLYFKSMIPRKGNEFRRLFDASGADGPASLNRSRVLSEIRTQRANISYGRPISNPEIDQDIWRRAFGHMLWWLSFRACRGTIRSCGNFQPLSEMAFQAAAVAAFGRLLGRTDFSLNPYYSEKVARAIADAQAV